MATLHLIRSNGFTCNKLAQCLSVVQQQDILLLIDDGVYNVAHSSIATIDNQWFALSSHMQARGLSSTAENVIGYQKMVELTEQATKVITWQ